jgi:DNA-binding transcriptional regulator GbsR (MarR family)
LDEKESLLEDIQEFTLADLRKYTNISDNTIREKMNALVELGLLVKDERRRTHTYMVPSEFDEDVKSIFPDQEKNDGEADTGSQSTLKSSAKSTELLRPDPTIENLYTDFISELLGSGFVKTSTELLRLEPDITGE